MKKIVDNLHRLDSQIVLKGLFFLGFLLRLINISGPNYWRDEAFTINVAKNNSFLGIIEIAGKDTTPPLHLLISRIVGEIFGYSELPQRLISLVFGMITLYFIYKIARVIFKSENLVRLTLLISAISPMLVLYSQEARAYAMLTAATAAVVFYTIKINQTSKFIDYFKIAIFSLIGLYSHNIFIVVFAITFILKIAEYLYSHTREKSIDRKVIMKFVTTYVVTFLCYLPWLFIFLSQYNTVQSKGFWLKFDPIPDVISNFGKFFTGEILRYDPKFIEQLLVPGIMAIGVTALFVGIINEIRNYRNQFPRLSFLLIGFLTLVFILSFKTPFYYIRYLIFVIPLVFILAANGLAKFQGTVGRRVAQGIAVIFVTLMIVYTTLSINFNYNQKENYREAIASIQYQPTTDVVLHNNGLPVHGFRFYATIPSYIFNTPDKLNYYEGLAAFTGKDYYDGSLQKYKRVWTFNLWEDEGFNERIEKQGFHLIKSSQFNGNIVVTLFARN